MVSLRHTRFLRWAIAFVALAFVASTAVSSYWSLKIPRAAEQLTRSEVPKVRNLIAIRGDLLDTTAALARWAGAPSELTRARVRASHRQAHEAMSEFARRPWNENDRAASERAAAAFARFDTLFDHTLRDSPNSQPVEELLAELQRTDVAVGELLIIETETTYARAAHIDRVWRNSTVLELALDVVCVALALFTSWMALRLVRRYTQFLEERANELDQFSGRMAHDVLSPLTTLSLAVPMLARRAGDDSEAAKLATRAMSSLHRVRTIVDGLLDFARAGARPSTEARADVREVVSGLLIELGPEAEERKVELKAEPFDGALVACAPGVLSSLVANLVRNAMKFMGDSVIRRVTVRVRKAGARVRIEVQDTGPGLPADTINGLFEPYARGIGSREPGLGLGLATVKRLAEAHRGAVNVHSEPGRGSIFSVELPRAA